MISKVKNSKVVNKIESLLTIKNYFKNNSEALITKLNELYCVNDKIGYGAYGIVFSASRNSDDEPVAIKVIKKKNVTSWTKEETKKIPSEIHMMHKCKGFPGIVQLFEWHSLLDYYIIIMSKPSKSMDLRDFVNMYKCLNEDVARFLFQQIVKAVKYCLDRDVVHKDIKMENIVLDLETGKTMLIDLGAATSKNIKCKQIQGTAGYVPPEWFLYEMYLDEAGTVWSLGILLYGMLNGHLPFATEFEIYMHRTKSMSFFDDHVYSTEAQRLIENCLLFDFATRFTIEEIIQDKWFKKLTLDWDKLKSNE